MKKGKTELRPCPFCGGMAEVRHNNDGFSVVKKNKL